jgi:surface antigen
MKRFWIVVVAMGLLPTPGLGQIGWGRITKGGPFQEFRDGDWEMFRQNVVRAAEAREDENPITWTNAKTGAQGIVKVAKRFDDPKLGECRDLQGNTSARGRTGPFAVTLCRQPGGSWRLL